MHFVANHVICIVVHGSVAEGVVQQQAQKSWAGKTYVDYYVARKTEVNYYAAFDCEVHLKVAEKIFGNDWHDLNCFIETEPRYERVVVFMGYL